MDSVQLMLWGIFSEVIKMNYTGLLKYIVFVAKMLNQDNTSIKIVKLQILNKWYKHNPNPDDKTTNIHNF